MYRSVEREIQELSRIHAKPLKCTLQMEVAEDQAREILRLVHRKLDRFYAQLFFRVNPGTGQTSD
jgi:hypothetical protein